MSLSSKTENDLDSIKGMFFLTQNFPLDPYSDSFKSTKIMRRNIWVYLEHPDITILKMQ